MTRVQPLNSFWRFMKPPKLLFLCLVADYLLIKVVARPMPLVPNSLHLAGLAFLVGGPALGVWAVLQFRKARTTVEPGNTPSALVRTGPYRYTRNPMYLGLATLLVGWAVLSNNALCLAAPAVFLVIVSLVFVPWEEREIERVFGADYVEMKRAVPRWLF